MEGPDCKTLDLDSGLLFLLAVVEQGDCLGSGEGLDDRSNEGAIGGDKELLDLDNNGPGDRIKSEGNGLDLLDLEGKGIGDLVSLLSKGLADRRDLRGKDPEDFLSLEVEDNGLLDLCL